MEEVLLLTHRIPYPPNKGDKIRSYHLLRHLAERYRVHLGTFIDDPADWAHVPRLREMCGETCFRPIRPAWRRAASLRGLLTGEALTLPYYRDRRLVQWVQGLMAERSVRRAIAFSSATAQYLDGAAVPPWIADLVDVDSDKWRQYAQRRRGPLGWLYGREARRLAHWEAQVAARAERVLLVSQQEVALFRRTVTSDRGVVEALPNGVDTAYFDPAVVHSCPYSGTGPRVVFTGAMDYWPNVDAVTWFATDVLPTLRELVPALTFWIVGARPDPAVRALGQQPGVVVTGTVADVRPYLAHADVCVAPLRTARGIQNKVLEAMAMGRPTVVTPQALEGLDVRPGHEVLMAQEVGGLRDAVLRAVRGEAAAIGRAGRGAVMARYSWPGVLERLDTLLGEPWRPAVQRASAAGG